jgi:hypothetical protein
MTHSIHYHVPKTRGEIIASLEEVHAQAGTVWQRFSSSEFFAPPAVGGWTVAQNVEHLIKSTSPVTLALGLPRLGLRLLFGTARAPSRSFVQVREAYRAVLSQGGEAGRFSPRDVRQPDNPADAHRRLLAKWRKLLPGLTAAIHRWDDVSLDRYRLPHPLLGKLTVREMLYFTIYHLGHHAEIVAARPR